MSRRASWWIALGLFSGHLVLQAPMRGPMIFGDEAGYLGTARFLIGQAPDLRLTVPGQAYGSYLSTGYSFALSPLLLPADDPAYAYRVALVFNAAIAALAFLLLEAFARRSLGVPERTARLAALAVSVHPILALQPLIAWPETLLALSLPALMVSMERFGDRPTIGRAAAAAATATAIYWVHQRTVGVLLAVPLVLAQRRRLPYRAIVGVGTAMLAGALAVVLVNHAVWQHVSPFGGSPAATVRARLLQGDGLVQAVLSAAGVLWYASASTLGLAVLGAWTLWRRVAAAPETALGAATSLLAAAALFALSAAFVIIPDRVDKLFYGRYLEPALAPLMVAGIAALERPLRTTVSLAIAALPLVLAVVLLVARGSAAFSGLFNPYCVIGFAPAVALTGRFRLLWTAAGSSVLAALALGLAHRRPQAARGALLVVFAAASVIGYCGVVVHDNALAQTSLQIPVKLRALPAALPVAYDDARPVPRAASAYSYWIPPRRLVVFDSRAAPPPAELVITGRSWPEGAARGARLLYPENAQDQGLWVLPGRLQGALASRGALFPADPRAALPPAACRARIESTTAVPRVPAGARRDVELRVRHAGHEAPWRSALAVDDAAGAVRVAVRWYSGDTLRADGRAELPASLAPGEETRLRVSLLARDAAQRPLPPGTYRVRIELVQELVQWFAAVEDSALVLNVEVVPPSYVDRLRARLPWST